MRNLRLSAVPAMARGKKGTTMVELLVSFFIVLIVVGVFSGIVSVSTRMLSASQRIMKDTEAFNTEYYKRTTSGTDVANNFKLSVDWDHVGFMGSGEGRSDGQSMLLKGTLQHVNITGSAYSMYRYQVEGY